VAVSDSNGDDFESRDINEKVPACSTTPSVHRMMKGEGEGEGEDEGERKGQREREEGRGSRITRSMVSPCCG
jgi:hypothetical protein